MDSIFKGYPFGSLLFWRTRERLKFDRKLGPFTLPEPQADYPIDYVLDGQQRVTSIYGVFQSELPSPQASTNWLPIYFDLEAEATAQDSQFVALLPAEAPSTRYFPLSTLFDTVSYRMANEGRSDGQVKAIDKMQEIFKEARIPLEMTSTTDKGTVAIIFERINRQGVKLETLQLLSAWTWSEEFQLQDQFSELAADLSPYGFGELGADSNLLLRCCSAILRADSSPQALMTINGAEVRNSFDRVINGVKYAVDYFRKNFGIEKLSNLPFTTLLVPLSVFFSVTGNREASVSDVQRETINRWFWRASFSKRYSSAVIRNLNTDIERMVELRDRGVGDLADFHCRISREDFLFSQFGLNNVFTKAFILLLASRRPLSFVSGQPVDLARTLKDANRTEFHHLMPRAFMRKDKAPSELEGCLANFAFLSRADNRLLGGDAPSEYRSKMPVRVQDILDAALTSETLFADNVPKFMVERASKIAQVAADLCGTDVGEPIWEVEDLMKHDGSNYANLDLVQDLQQNQQE